MQAPKNLPQTAPNGQPLQHNLIAWLTGLLTLLLALFSFILSFNALTDLAAAHGVSIPPLFPFVVEFAVVIFSLNALYRSLNSEPAKVQWILIIGSSLLAGLFNVAHAQTDVISRLMAAMPSLFLLLSFESFLSLVKHRVTRQGVTQSIEQLITEIEQRRSIVADLDNRLEQKRSKVTDLESRIAELERSKKAASIVQFGDLNAANEARLNGKQQALNTLLNFYRSNPNASLNEAGEAIGRSKGTVSNYLNELEQARLIHRNGQGVEVLS